MHGKTKQLYKLGRGMYFPAKLTLHYYTPLYVKRGMIFQTRIRDIPHLWEQTKEVVDNISFFNTYGYPVEVAIENARTGDQLAFSEEIKWIDDGEDVRKITLADINYILKNDGDCNIEVRRTPLRRGEVVPVHLKGGVILQIVEEDEEF